MRSGVFLKRSRWLEATTSPRGGLMPGVTEIDGIDEVLVVRLWKQVLTRENQRMGRCALRS